MDPLRGLPLDYARFAHTGWTRGHRERILARLTYGYENAEEPSNAQGKPSRMGFG